VIRFSRWVRFQHAAVILLFTLLLVTGMPQKWPYAEASRWIVKELGGVFAVRWLHRMSGIAFALMTVAHLGTAIGGLLTRRVQPSMLFTAKDFSDAVDSLRYYLGRIPEAPRFGRYDYRQKFEYWGLVFGGIIMITTGLVLYLPILTTRYLPGEVLPAAQLAHGNEGLMAFLVVILWHIYNAHLSPDVFPFDKSIFTGKISLERMQHEHPLELARIKESGEVREG